MNSLGYQIPRIGRPLASSKLKRQCADQKARRPQLRRLEKLEGEVRRLRKERRKLTETIAAHQLRAMAAEARLGAVVAISGEPDALTDEHKQWMRDLHTDGQSVNFIAQKMELDLVTTAMVIEGLA